MYPLHDSYAEALADRHDARLIQVEADYQERVRKPLKRDYRKYQNLRIKKNLPLQR